MRQLSAVSVEAPIIAYYRTLFLTICLTFISIRCNSNRYMARRTSSSPEVLLGLLAIEPMSGYDLGQTIQNSIRHFWNESYGQIYPNLQKLAKNGLVRSKTERQKSKPDRRVYSITDKGLKRLRAWLKADPQPEVPRNEMLLKLFFGAQASVPAMIDHLERMSAQENAVLHKLIEIESQVMSAVQQHPDALYWHMTLRFGQIELEAHQRWAEETLAELRRIAPDQKSKSKPIRKTENENARS